MRALRRIHHGMTGGNPIVDQMVAAALLFNEIEQLKLGDLGEIKHGSGHGLFSD